MRLALDTNILVYAEGVNTVEQQTRAEYLLAGLADDEVLIPAQVLAELFAVLSRRLSISSATARTRVLGWSGNYSVIGTSRSVLEGAMELTGRHRIAFWDAIVLASAAEAGCRQLLSEDMQAGFTWRGVTIRNPFAATR